MVNLDRKFFIFIFAISSILPVLGVRQNFQKSDISKIAENSSAIKIKSQKNRTRLVQKYKTNSKNIGDQIFKKLQNKYTKTNISVKIKNKSSFDFRLNFVYFDIFGTQHNTNSLITSSNKDRFVNISAKLLDKSSVNVKQNNKFLTENIFRSSNPQKLDLTKVIPTSIAYEIDATGSWNNHKIEFFQTYILRGTTDHKKNPQRRLLGYFNVNNVNNNTKKNVIGSSVGSLIIFTIIVVIVFALFATIGKRVWINKIETYGQSRRKLLLAKATEIDVNRTVNFLHDNPNDYENMMITVEDGTIDSSRIVNKTEIEGSLSDQQTVGTTGKHKQREPSLKSKIQLLKNERDTVRAEQKEAAANFQQDFAEINDDAQKSDRWEHELLSQHLEEERARTVEFERQSEKRKAEFRAQNVSVHNGGLTNEAKMKNNAERLKKMNAELATLQEEKSKLTNLNEEWETKSSQIENQMKERSAAVLENDSKQQQITEIQAQVAESRAKYETVTKKLLDSQAESEQLGKRIADLKERTDYLHLEEKQLLEPNEVDNIIEAKPPDIEPTPEGIYNQKMSSIFNVYPENLTASELAKYNNVREDAAKFIGTQYGGILDKIKEEYPITYQYWTKGEVDTLELLQAYDNKSM